jgi:HSP20 family molecular chaperone IbpA
MGEMRIYEELSGRFLLGYVLRQTPKAFEVKADLPGVDKKDVKVNVDGDVLSLSVEKATGSEEKKEEEGVKYHR